MAPLRQAVRLVQHPGADLTLGQDAAHGDAAKLLRRDDEDAGVSQAHSVRSVGPLRHGQKPVDGDAGTDAPRLEPRHLVGHEGDQRRNHYRQRACLVVAGQGRYLIAERLAGAGGQDCQHVLPRHRRLDDGLLHRLPGVVQRLRPEVGEPEPVMELLAGVVPFPAPAAGGIGAGGVAQPADQPPRIGELMPHPGRHDRIAPGHRQPRQRIGQRPAVPDCIRHDLTGVRLAGVAGQLCVNRLIRLGVGWPWQAPQRCEDPIEPRSVVRRGKPMPGCQQVGRRIAQEGPMLIVEDPQRDSGVQGPDSSCARV